MMREGSPRKPVINEYNTGIQLITYNFFTT